MTAPAAPPCTHCKTAPTARRLQTRLLGSKPVDLALCDCDYLRCRKCKRTTRGLPMGVHHCPDCGTAI